MWFNVLRGKGLEGIGSLETDIRTYAGREGRLALAVILDE